MKKIWRKALWGVIMFGGFIALTAFFPVSVSAETGTVSGSYGTNITWTLDSEGVLTITGNGAIPDASNTGEIPWYSSREEIVSVVIEDGVTKIGDVAFQKCINLKNVVIPNNVTYIGSYAFYECTSLEEIDWPQSLSWIGEYAFYNCINLKAIELHENLSIILWSAFARCSSLTTVNVPDKVTYIDVAVFSRCTNLVSIEMSENIDLIDESAFYMCNNLTEVYYAGTEEQWEVINIKSDNGCLTNANIHYNSCMEDDNDTVIEITVQPQNQNVLEDEAVSFFIEAIGDSLTYQWEYVDTGSNEWKNCYLSGYNTPTLSTKAVVYRDRMQFRCVVSDASGNSVTSNAAMITINKEPQMELVILTQPMSQTVEENAEVSFTVEAEGTGVKYQWEYAEPGSDEWKKCYLNGYNTPTLNTKAVVYRDGMQFRCIVEDVGKNTVPSNAAVITINREPQVELAIVTQPVSQTVDENTEVSFSVEAEGTGLKYHWEYAEPGSDEWKNCYLNGYNTPILNTKAVVYRDGMQFRCIVEDVGKNKVTSDTVMITINKEPQVELAILKQPVSQTVEENAEVSFTVEAEGTGVKYQWEYAEPGSEEWQKCYLNGYNAPTLNTRAVVYRDGMQFRCIIEDVGKNTAISDTVMITINKEPQVELAILTQPVSQTVEENAEVSFAVEAEGTGLKYQWEYMEPGSDEWQNCYLSGYDTSVLVVKAVAYRSGMQFRCSVTDIVGNVDQSGSATLIIIISQNEEIKNEEINNNSEDSEV